MSLINSVSWKCDYPDCLHEWLAKKVDGEWVPPEKCAKCRRRGWDKNAGRGESAGLEQKKAGHVVGTRTAASATPPLGKERPAEAITKIPGVKLGKDMYKPYVPEKYRDGGKSKFFKE